MARIDRPEHQDRSGRREGGLKDRVRGLGRDGKFRDSPDRVTDPDDSSKNAMIDHIFTVGFPWATGTEEAREETKRIARETFGRTIRFAKVFREDTAEHKENGEFLITAWIIDLIDRTKPQPPIGEGTKK